jgi:hypothetical protein
VHKAAQGIPAACLLLNTPLHQHLLLLNPCWRQLFQMSAAMMHSAGTCDIPNTDNTTATDTTAISCLQELMAASRLSTTSSKEPSKHAQDWIAAATAAEDNLSEEGQRRSSETLPKQRKLSSDLLTTRLNSSELPPLQEGVPASNGNLGSHDGSIGQSWIVQGPKYEQVAVEEPAGRCCLYWLPFRVSLLIAKMATEQVLSCWRLLQNSITPLLHCLHLVVQCCHIYPAAGSRCSAGLGFLMLLARNLCGSSKPRFSLALTSAQQAFVL